MITFFKICATIILFMLWGGILRGCQATTTGGTLFFSNLFCLVILIGGLVFIWRYQPDTKQPTILTPIVEQKNQQLYDVASNIKVLPYGAYACEANSNYYNFLIFKNDLTCSKVTVSKNNEQIFSRPFFLQQIDMLKDLNGNKGYYRYDATKNELVIRFHLDLEQPQTFRCKLRTTGVLVANIFFEKNNTKDIREYTFDKNFKQQFLI